MSFFNDLLHEWGLPAIAIGLLLLAISGIGIFFVPVVRRWNYQRSKRQDPKIKG